MKIYFARSIRGNTNGNGEELQQSLRIFGEVLSEKFDYTKNPARDNEIFANDMKMLESADVVIAEVSNPSIGVGYEIATAEKRMKPILCLAIPNVLVSAMITANPSFAFVRYSSIEEAHAHIRTFLSEIRK